nr:Chain D, Protein diaphanous homolog 3 [Homo sapiens]
GGSYSVPEVEALLARLRAL